MESDERKPMFGLGYGSDNSSATGMKRRASDFFDEEVDFNRSTFSEKKIESSTNDTDMNKQMDDSNSSSIDNTTTTTSSSISSTERNKSAPNYLKRMQTKIQQSFQSQLINESKLNEITKNKTLPDRPNMDQDLLNAIEDNNVQSISSQYKWNSSKFNLSIINSTDSTHTIDPSSSNHVVMSDVLSSVLPIYKTLKSGDEVMAKHSGDGKYYYATIKTIIHKGYPSAKYDIKFHDYDTIETISWKDIYIVENKSENKNNNNNNSNHVVDVFGRDLTKRSESNHIPLPKINTIPLPSPLLSSPLILDTTLPNLNEANLSLIQRVMNPPVFLSGLSDIKEDEYINMEILKSMKGSWKVIPS